MGSVNLSPKNTKQDARHNLTNISNSIKYEFEKLFHKLLRRGSQWIRRDLQRVFKYLYLS
jgi:hypothetical protein